MSRRTQFRLLVALTIVWAVWAGWSLLGRATPYELRVLNDLGAPLHSAVVDVEGAQVGTSDESGRVHLEWEPSSTVLEVSAPGHITQMLTVAERPEGVIDIVLNARVLRGLVLDPEGNGVQGATVKAGAASVRTDPEGRFSIRGAEPGNVTVERPAWQSTAFTWDGGSGEAVAELHPITARAVHISGEAARDQLGEFIDMALETELNALMIDLKDESGLVWYETQDATAIEVGANFDAFDLGDAVARAHANDLYVIGRLVVFNDPIAALKKPDMAVWDADASAPYSANGQYFLDPTDPAARQYGLDLAVEACALGVDEVQFDYVRFPDARTEAATFDQGVGADVRAPTISGFLNDAVSLLHPMGCAVGADVFGFVTAATDDGAIGQRWEDVAMIVDVVSPMVYPSHYDSGWYGFEDPNANPGPMVENAIRDGMDRLPRTVIVRPWLQDFGYDPSQVRAQISSAEQFGLGWMLWNAKSAVTVEALLPG